MTGALPETVSNSNSQAPEHNPEMQAALRQTGEALLHCMAMLNKIYRHAHGPLLTQIHTVRPLSLHGWKLQGERALAQARQFVPDLNYTPREDTLEVHVDA